MTNVKFFMSVMDFKTSHVIVYRKATASRYRNQCISKHLMLLFIIRSEFALCQILLDFKTSHVIVYLKTDDLKEQGLTFQNISCYCLSMH